jgi:hypothetical protein
MAAQPQEPFQTGSGNDPYLTSPDMSLYLFACQIYYLRYGNLRAYAELVSAARSTDPQLRSIAESFLSNGITQDDVLPGTGRRSAPACQTCCS